MNAGGAQAPVDLVELGRVRGAYGLQGWVHIHPYSGQASLIRVVRQWWLLPAHGRPWSRPQPAAGEQAQALDVIGVRGQGAGLIAKWKGCDNPELAQALKGSRIALARAVFPSLPPGQHYWIDLIGVAVVNRAGVMLGTVAGLRDNGAQELLEVAAAAPGTAVGAQGSRGVATLSAEAGAGAGAAAADALLLIPMVPAYIEDIDRDAGQIRVDWQPDW